MKRKGRREERLSRVKNKDTKLPWKHLNEWGAKEGGKRGICKREDKGGRECRGGQRGRRVW